MKLKRPIHVNSRRRKNFQIFKGKYRKSSIKSPRGLFISNTFEGVLNRAGGLLNLANSMVSFLHKGLEYKVENLGNEKLEVMQTRIKNKSELPVG